LIRQGKMLMGASLGSKVWSGSRQRQLEEIGLHPSRQFCAILDRERALVDRNDHMFSLLVFDLTGYCTSWPKVRAFAKIGAARLRKTDMMGWMDDRQTGILLPFTSFAGAKRVADDVISELAKEGMHSACVVYTYPTGDGKGGDGDGQRTLSDGAGESPLASGSPSAGEGQSGTAPGSGRAGDLDGPAPEHELKSMFLPRFPRWKRAMDIVLSLLLLILALPVMLLIAIMIKVVSPRGGVLFKQERVGFLGNRFTCLKFRSMHVHSEEALHQRHLQHLMQANVPMTKLDTCKDKRVIPMGSILRASGLDELPQLLNILRGDMSLIGPRPCLHYEYKGFLRWHRMRFDTMPGLTGLWQVSGKNRTTFTQMMRLDVSYTQQKSLWKDLRIMIKTVPAVVKQVVDMAR
jgi:lipopolysaccharide/colanic/teichoic acid biosynthesis glycosyltransferase